MSIVGRRKKYKKEIGFFIAPAYEGANGERLSAPTIPCLAADIEGYVFVFDHMSDKVQCEQDVHLRK